MILFLFLLFSLPSHSLRATRFIAGQHKRASTQGIPARHTAQHIQVLRCAGLMARICAGKAVHAPLVVNYSGFHKATGFTCTFRSKAFKMLRITVCASLPVLFPCAHANARAEGAPAVPAARQIAVSNPKTNPVFPCFIVGLLLKFNCFCCRCL